MSPENLTIKLIDTSYVDDIFNALTISRAEIAQYLIYISNHNLTKKEILAWVEGKILQQENSSYTFVSLCDNMFCGCCSITKIDTHRANVGYWTSTPYTKKGYTTQFIKLLLQWAYTNTRFHRFEFIMDTTNIGSIHVAKNVGATLEGVQRDRIHKDGKFYDAYCFLIIKDENLNVS